VDELIVRCREGDPKAKDEFVDRYCGLICSAVVRVATGRIPNDPALSVEDIVQDVFLRLFRDDARLLRSYDPRRAAMTTWLTVVARSTTLDSLRKRRLATVPLDPAEHAAPVDEDEKGPATALLPRDLLAPRQMLVLHLLFDQGMDVPAAAKLLAVKPQSIRSTKHKAISRLREFFGVTPGPGCPEGDAPPRPRV